MMTADNKKEQSSSGKTAWNATNGFSKGAKFFELLNGYKYKFKFQNGGKLSIIDTTVKGGNNWVFRLDKPHKGIDTNHININPKFSGAADPHVPLPNGALTAGTATAKFARYMNNANKYVLFPLAVAIDTASVGYSAYQDYNNGTTRRTVETTATIAGAWGGGYGGAVGGAAAGTAFFPGIGTIVGGICGGIIGGITGSLGMNKVTRVIGDTFDYDMRSVKCVECDKEFKIRKYLGEGKSKEEDGKDEKRKEVKEEEEEENFLCSDCLEEIMKRTCRNCTDLNNHIIDEEHPCDVCQNGVSVFNDDGNDEEDEVEAEVVADEVERVEDDSEGVNETSKLNLQNVD